MPVKSRNVIPIPQSWAHSTQTVKILTDLFLTFIFVLMPPAGAMAYVGPGAGITLIGALWAVVVAIVLMVGGLLVWPLRAFLRRRKNSRTKEARAAEPGR